DGSIDLVETQLVHPEELEALTGGGAVDIALSANLGEVPDPPEEAVRHARRAPGTLRYPDRTLGVDLHLQDPGRPLDDGAQVRSVVEIEPSDEAEAVPQRPRDEAGTGGRTDQRELRQLQAYGASGGPLADQDVQPAVLHRRIEHLFHGAV